MSVILVTGGNRGIGHAIVQRLGSVLVGATLLVGCRSLEAGNESIHALREHGIPGVFEAIAITITDDSSVRTAVKAVEDRYGKLDILINNAGAVPVASSQEMEDVRRTWNEGLDCLFTSQVIVTKAFMPLLRMSNWGRVIMVSSARGSLTRNSALDLPPSRHWVYDCSKAALNLAMIEFENSEVREVPVEMDRIKLWAASPGHCKTGFNNFRGTKDPLEGAEVVVRLALSKRGEIPSGTSWEYENGSFHQIPW